VRARPSGRAPLSHLSFEFSWNLNPHDFLEHAFDAAEDSELPTVSVTFFSASCSFKRNSVGYVGAVRLMIE
jgi:hypothetical protein